MDKPRTVVVTGAGSGIGAATAKKLMDEGWRVACLDRNREAAQKVAGSEPVIEVDVADEKAVVAAFKDIAALFGTLDALVTCAGIYETTTFEETNAEIFARLLAVNVTGTFLCLREAAKMMQAGARICTVSSVAGLRGGGLAGTISYATSKGAILALTKNAARVLGSRGIAVNTVAPGMIDTPFAAVPLSDPSIRTRVEAMTSFGRLGTAEDIADVIAWLVSPEAAYVHGATIVADGGMVMY